mgnify:CR=1 FL=1
MTIVEEKAATGTYPKKTVAILINALYALIGGEKKVLMG